MRKAWRFATLALAMTTAVATVAACSQRNPTINRVEITPYWTKADFNPNDVWYYATTVIESAPNAGAYGGPGDGDFLVTERLRWEVTERQLVGWRDYAAAPGSEDDGLQGGDEAFRGQPVAVFPIVDHFDIRHAYDPMSGELSNEIVENRERPWYDREYFRVDWSRNLVPTYEWRVAKVNQIASSAWAVQQDDVGDPKRWRFDRDSRGSMDYMEVTTRSSIAPDFWSVVGMYGPGYFIDLEAVVVDIRHSFKKVDPNNDYIPLNMPDNVVLVDENGEEVRDENGISVKVPVFDRFGFFTTWDRPVWDPERGFTSWGERNYAVRLNVWEKNRDENGMEIPVENRTPKAMHWYTNVQHPTGLMNAANRVANEWNNAFKEMVFHAQPGKYATLAEVPEMFILHENSCNIANVKAKVAALPSDIANAVIEGSKDYNFNGDLDGIEERIAWANNHDNDAGLTDRVDLEAQAKSDLERVCSALEYYTDISVHGDESIEKFVYERDGDLRFHMFNAIVEKTTAPWIGVATILADPITGEEIKAGANLGVSAVDMSVFRANEAIRAMNGEIDLNDFFWSRDIRAYMQDKLQRSERMRTTAVSDQLKAEMETRFSRFGGAGKGMRDPISPERDRARLSRLAGSTIEDKLFMENDVVSHFPIPSDILERTDGDIEAARLEMTSPLRSRQDILNWEQREQMFDRMGQVAMDPIEYIDQYAIGAALQYRDLTNRERIEKIREDTYVSVMLHEVGHAIGLRHNFEASSDAINYGPEFWEMEALPTDIEDAIGATDNAEWAATLEACLDQLSQMRQEFDDYSLSFSAQECLGQNQYMYSTIMEYNGHWTADFAGLRPYDYQAIKYGYAQLLEVFDAPTTDRTDRETDRWSRLNDWRDIVTDVVPSKEDLYKRSYVKWKWDDATVSSLPPVNTVPYRFCTDMYMTDTCNRWDFGPDQRTNAAYQEYMYYQRYFFTHFNRDQYWDYYGGGWQNAAYADQRAIADYTHKMRWYFFRKMTDPDFTGSYAEEDHLATAVMGLNHMMHVLGHPSNGVYINVPQYFVDGYTVDDPNTVDRLAPSNIMRPFDYLDQCDAFALAELEEVQTPNSPVAVVRPTAPAPGYVLSDVALGDGRPFFWGTLYTDSEEWIFNYVGSYFGKEAALGYLASSAAWFPRLEVDGYLPVSESESYYVSWYRLFPNEVGNIFKNLVTENDPDLGMLVDADGNLMYRDVIGPDGNAPDYSGYNRVVPSLATNLQYYALVYSLALMSSERDGAYDMEKSFIVASDGSVDDLELFESLANDPATADLVVEFKHPISGRTYRALDTAHGVAAEMVRRANVAKERFLALDDCAEGRSDKSQVDYCKCALTLEQRLGANGQPSLYCVDPYLETPGEGLCGEYELVHRRDRALELLDRAVDFLDDIRLLRSAFIQ